MKMQQIGHTWIGNQDPRYTADPESFTDPNILELNQAAVKQWEHRRVVRRQELTDGGMARLLAMVGVKVIRGEIRADW